MDLAYLLEKMDMLTLSLGNLTEGEADNSGVGISPPLLIGARQRTLSLLLTGCCRHQIS